MYCRYVIVKREEVKQFCLVRVPLSFLKMFVCVNADDRMQATKSG